MIKRRRADNNSTTLGKQAQQKEPGEIQGSLVQNNQCEEAEEGTLMQGNELTKRETRVSSKKPEQQLSGTQRLIKSLNPEQQQEHMPNNQIQSTTEETCTDDSTYSQGQEEARIQQSFKKPKRKIELAKKFKSIVKKKKNGKLRHLDKDELLAHLWAKRGHQFRKMKRKIYPEGSLQTSDKQLTASSESLFLCPLLRNFEQQSLLHDPRKSIITISLDTVPEEDVVSHQRSEIHSHHSVRSRLHDVLMNLNEGIATVEELSFPSNHIQEPLDEGDPERFEGYDPLRESRIEMDVQSSFSQYSLENYVDPLIEYENDKEEDDLSNHSQDQQK